ncbi:MAG TPA: cytochrome C oxidase subunit IV family protein [Longimicrobiales bacterium]|nr:cytochrome C oxidase subunit IV family protein [Longimicrobiales bacterium]
MVDIEKSAEGAAAVEDHEAHKDPPYFVIWFVLLVLTMAEVGYAFMSLPKAWLIIGLVVMAFWKATLVALYYMHLRFEPRRLWVLAASPLPLVAILILAVITEF